MLCRIFALSRGKEICNNNINCYKFHLSWSNNLVGGILGTFERGLSSPRDLFHIDMLSTFRVPLAIAPNRISGKFFYASYEASKWAGSPFLG